MFINVNRVYGELVYEKWLMCLDELCFLPTTRMQHELLVQANLIFFSHNNTMTIIISCYCLGCINFPHLCEHVILVMEI